MCSSKSNTCICGRCYLAFVILRTLQIYDQMHIEKYNVGIKMVSDRVVSVVTGGFFNFVMLTCMNFFVNLMLPLPFEKVRFL